MPTVLQLCPHCCKGAETAPFGYVEAVSPYKTLGRLWVSVLSGNMVQKGDGVEGKALDGNS
jgi:hypothetical protein